jgi:4-hydroxyphenylacetate 3-monooxygenase
MLRSGAQYLEGIRDGRRVYVGRERVTDVTTHPAFRNSARSFASLFDRKKDAANIDVMSYQEDGDRFSTWYLLAKSKDDLRKRAAAHKMLAKWSYGLLGRSPDHVASFVTGLAMAPALFEGNRAGFGQNLLRYHDYLRRNDLFASYVVLSPQGARNPALYNRAGKSSPTLQVTKESDDGIELNGIKMLGTGAVFSDVIWVGNLLPLAPDQKQQAVTCSVPANAEGVSIWARKSSEHHALGPIDSPFSSRYDESDCVVLFENAKVPWEHVFLLDDPGLSREMYFKTPSHVMGNHQAVVRFLEKLGLIIGFAYKAAELNDVLQVPAVRETLSKLAASEAALRAMIAGSIEDAETIAGGYMHVNRRELYAALLWCTNNYHLVAETVREMLGAGPFQMPANANFLSDAELRDTFETYWAGSNGNAIERLKFMKLAWDYLGSELAMRHSQYERFYAGPQFVHAFYNFGNCPWEDYKTPVEEIMNGMELPEAVRTSALASAQIPN